MSGKPHRPERHRPLAAAAAGLAVLAVVLLGLRGLGWALGQVLPDPKPAPASTGYHEPATVCIDHDPDGGCVMRDAP